MSALGVLSGHLSVSTAATVSAGQVGIALAAGHLSTISDATARALVGGIFGENDPDLILRAAMEAGGTIESANSLYLEARADGLPCSPAWEKYMREAL